MWPFWSQSLLLELDIPLLSRLNHAHFTVIVVSSIPTQPAFKLREVISSTFLQKHWPLILLIPSQTTRKCLAHFWYAGFPKDLHFFKWPFRSVMFNRRGSIRIQRFLLPSCLHGSSPLFQGLYNALLCSQHSIGATHSTERVTSAWKLQSQVS